MQLSVIRSLLVRKPDAAHELGLATAGMASTNFLMLGIAALIPVLRHEFALEGAEIGLVVATPWLTAALCGIPASRLTERLGGGPAVGIGQLFVIVAAAVVATASNVGVFFVGLALIGVGYGIVNPASNVLSTGSVPARRRGLAMSVKQSGVNVGGFVAGLTLPGAAALTSWRFALVLPALAAAAVAVWGFSLRARGSRRPLVVSDRTVEIGRVRLGFYGFAMAGVQVAIFGYAAVYLVDRHGFSPQLAGVGLAVALGAGLVGRIAWGMLSDSSRDRVWVLQLASIGSACALVLLPFAPGASIWILLVVIGLFTAGWNGAFHAVVAESAGARGVGRATGFALLFLYFGNVLVPPSLGLVIEYASWSWFWWVGAAGAAGAALIVQGAKTRELVVGA